MWNIGLIIISFALQFMGVNIHKFITSQEKVVPSQYISHERWKNEDLGGFL